MKYEELKDRQQKEFNDLPITYAFGNDQLEEAIKRLGAKDISECCTIFGHGDVVKKENVSKVMKTIKRHNKELTEAMKDPEFAYDAFLYEMCNHEYGINWDGDFDVLNCFGMKEEDLDKLGLQCVYQTARRKYFELAYENDWF